MEDDMAPSLPIKSIDLLKDGRAVVFTPLGHFVSNRSVPNPPRYKEWYMAQGYITLSVLTAHYKKS